MNEERPDDMVSDEDNEEDDDNNNNSNVPLPRNTMLMEDRDVERGTMYRMSKGHGCQIICKGWVSGITEQDSRNAYYKYINVDVSNCYDRETLYPTLLRPHHEWSAWNATVSQLQFYKPKDSNIRKIPKRLSRPTEVRRSQAQCENDNENYCYRYDQRSFGFAVYIPRFDMQVKWRVEWEVTAYNPYMSMDEENEGLWFNRDCEEIPEYDSRSRYEKNAFPIDWEDGFAFWKPVGGQSRDDDRYNERRESDGHGRRHEGYHD